MSDRARTEHAAPPKRRTPVALRVQKFLAGIHYPARKHELLACARSRGADEDVMMALLSLPDQHYNSPISLSCEVGRQAAATRPQGS
jgi:hypothetical protein